MRNKTYWALGVLIVLIIGTAGVLFIRHNLLEVAELEQQARETESLSLSREQSTAPASPPPPLGETADTGFWEGNTWHQKPAPKPKKKGFWEREITLSEHIDRGASISEGGIIVRNQPYSEAALFAMCLWADVEDLKSALKYHPESPALHAQIAEMMFSAGGEGKSGLFHEYSPEEVVAFAKKSLRLLQHSTEDPRITPRFYSSTAECAHGALGIAYQYLGDYASALFHLKAGQRLFEPIGHPFLDKLSADMYANNIAAIESGNPKHKPKSKPTSQSLTSSPALPSSSGAGASASVSMPPVPPMSDLPGTGAESHAISSEDALTDSEAHALFMRDVQDRRQRQEFESFLRWMDQIESAKSPADLEDFLMREMATQLQGGVSEFTPERLIRAFETFNRHGETEGMRALEKRDAEIARRIARQQRSSQVPPQLNNKPKFRERRTEK